MRALAACAALWLASASVADDELYVYQVPMTADPAAVTDAGLHVLVHSNAPAALRKRVAQSSATLAPGDGDALRLTLAGRDTLLAAPSGADLAATFLIDFDQPALQALNSDLGEVGEGEAATRRLSAFVHGLMGTAPYSRAFDVASRVAENREGDCTEHAVLLTALARARGFPARTVIGLIVLTGGRGDGAYGHAWSEIWADGAWRLADATQPEKEFGGRVFYLPVGALTSEGMGYAMGLFDLVNAMPTRLTAVADE